MQKEFDYKIKIDFSVFFWALFFAAGSVLCQIFSVSISFKGFNILPYPASVYLSGLIALLFIFWCFGMIKNKSKTSKVGNKIILTDEAIFMSQNLDESKAIKYSNINKIYKHYSSDDGEYLNIVKIRGKSKSIHATSFRSGAEFMKFANSLSKLSGKNLES